MALDRRPQLPAQPQQRRHDRWPASVARSRTICDRAVGRVLPHAARDLRRAAQPVRHERRQRIHELVPEPEATFVEETRRPADDAAAEPGRRPAPWAPTEGAVRRRRASQADAAPRPRLPATRRRQLRRPRPGRAGLRRGLAPRQHARCGLARPTSSSGVASSQSPADLDVETNYDHPAIAGLDIEELVASDYAAYAFAQNNLELLEHPRARRRSRYGRGSTSPSCTGIGTASSWPVRSCSRFVVEIEDNDSGGGLPDNAVTVRDDAGDRARPRRAVRAGC